MIEIRGDVDQRAIEQLERCVEHWPKLDKVPRR